MDKHKEHHPRNYDMYGVAQNCTCPKHSYRHRLISTRLAVVEFGDSGLERSAEETLLYRLGWLGYSRREQLHDGRNRPLTHVSVFFL